MLKKPSDEAKDQFQRINWFSRVMGLNNFDGKEINKRVIFIVFMGALEQVMHFHGLRQKWPNIADICSSSVVFILIIQLITRLVNKFIRHDEDNVQSLLSIFISFLEREELNLNHRSVLSAKLMSLESILNVYKYLSFVAFSIPNPTALIVSWYTGEFMLPAPVFLPYIDPQTFVGYAVNSSLQAFYVALLYVGFMSGDVLYIFFLGQCIPMVDIYCMKLGEFGVNLIEVKTEKKPKEIQPEPSTSKGVKREKTQKELEIERRALEIQKAIEIEKVEQELIALIKEFNSYNEYLNMTVKFMELTTFVVTSSNSMAIAMAIVVTLYSSKAIGSCMVIILLTQVIMPCILGTLISHQKEKLLDELYEFPWYELSLSKQKTFLQFIHLIQNSNELIVPIIDILNMEVFTDVINGAYSFLMFLKNMESID